ncbi:3-oxoacyl-ACP synthase [Cellulomonas fimi]|uniref:Beta-ketoacyl-acyl-carrier-protein synthase III n=1 Tax=Cellulomonas fimi (strain ATCC 484 / DSM 20113 / JCM 1341 / CCUG 24087 / LMG 16345 / NBRC 15513 / NCIMB 8980 / NCTC 7547 / NRS-133) TaxID=590998 RepID=F4H0G0_CELFA|nr:3-oxoacyl-ACP synthase [Cellulomonas fimi]AEE47329.1 Beta-ketoacyl-acyl-carrier-protein synthase III [Cellulomonas fimi ATCC 484]NNH05842.1 3-oxoacyl-ACP synthase [Cellulomonas fimi]VEH35939.1 3-oxoacyl-[acyl-carrier-protein] synthase 3 [Cellulomonas fimi]
MPQPPRPVPLPVRLLGTGVHRPSHEVRSEELDTTHGRAPGTSFARSGVRSRRWAAPEETSSAMAASAVAGALDAAGLGAADLDALVVSAVAPEQPMPTTAVLTAAALGIPGGRVAAFDVNASCVGFLTALDLATTGVAAGRWRRVAVVATEIASKGLDHRDVECSALFGDGAAAVVVGPADPGDGSAVLASSSAVWPEAWAACRIDAGGTRLNVTTPPADPSAYLFRMDGAALLRQVARHLPGFLRDVEERSGVARDEVDVVVPHQASAVGLRYLRERVGVKPDAVVDILEDHGNQVSASVPTALHHAVTSGALQRGGTALLLGTGAGLALSATVLRY